jgi:hypothetical protein
VSATSAISHYKDELKTLGISGATINKSKKSSSAPKVEATTLTKAKKTDATATVLKEATKAISNLKKVVKKNNENDSKSKSEKKVKAKATPAPTFVKNEKAEEAIKTHLKQAKKSVKKLKKAHEAEKKQVVVPEDAPTVDFLDTLRQIVDRPSSSSPVTLNTNSVAGIDVALKTMN